MIRPTFENLTRHASGGQGLFCSGTLGWQEQNPRLFKFKWWIFHAGSPAEDSIFLSDPRCALCTHDAMVLIDTLRREGRAHLIYNRRYRRGGPDAPWKKWDGQGEAPEYEVPFDEDGDPPWEGHR